MKTKKQRKDRVQVFSPDQIEAIGQSLCSIGNDAQALSRRIREAIKDSGFRGQVEADGAEQAKNGIAFFARWLKRLEASFMEAQISAVFPVDSSGAPVPDAPRTGQRRRARATSA